MKKDLPTKPKTKRMTAEECKEAVKLICDAFNLALVRKSQTISVYSGSGFEPAKKYLKDHKIVSSAGGVFHQTFEIQGYCKALKAHECVYATKGDDDDNEAEFVIIDELNESKAFKRLAKMLSGASLYFTSQKGAYAKIPKFSSLATLKLLLAIEGK